MFVGSKKKEGKGEEASEEREKRKSIFDYVPMAQVHQGCKRIVCHQFSLKLLTN